MTIGRWAVSDGQTAIQAAEDGRRQRRVPLSIGGMWRQGTDLPARGFSIMLGFSLAGGFGRIFSRVFVLS